MPESLTCRWLKKAIDDLKLAEKALEIDVDPGYAGFHAQQAAEKALKALLAFYKVKPPKTHDLWELTSLLGKLTEIEYHREIHIEDLTYYAVEARYPGPPVSREEAEAALETAGKVVEWVQNELGKRGIEC